MMNKYVVRQPIKDKQGNLFGYEILFQEEKGSGLYNQTNDYAAADSISNFLAIHGLINANLSFIPIYFFT